MRNMSNYIPLATKESMAPLSLPDCVHLSEKCKCDVLAVKTCAGKGCSFYQSARDKQESQRKYYEEMNSLSIEKQKEYADKYCGGKMPWRNLSNEL